MALCNINGEYDIESTQGDGRFSLETILVANPFDIETITDTSEFNLSVDILYGAMNISTDKPCGYFSICAPEIDMINALFYVYGDDVVVVVDENYYGFVDFK
jgi:hypothetical protein